MATSVTFAAFKNALAKDFSIKHDEVETTGRLSFIINDTREESLNSAVAAILRLRQEHSHLCFTFPLDVTALKSELQSQHFLTINRNVVCISDAWAPATAKTKFVDQLSRSLMREPMKCTEGHFLEKGRVVLWEKEKGNTCPCGESPHPLFSPPLKSVSELKVDTELKSTIQRYKRELETEQEQKEKLLQTQAKQAQKLAQQQSKIDEQETQISAQKSKIGELETEQTQHTAVLIQTTRPLIQPILPLVGGVFKVGLKLTLLQVLPVAIKAFKFIPGLSAIIGVGLCAYRISQICKRYESGNFFAYVWKNEKLEMAKALGELASGAIAFIPVVGTFVSAGMDGAIAIADAVQIWQVKKGHNDAVRELELEEVDAREALGVQLDASDQEIDRGYRKVAAVIHPDKDSGNPELQKHEEKMFKDLGKLKEAAKKD